MSMRTITERRVPLLLLALVSMMALRAETCEDHGLLANPGFDLWCGERLCTWELDQGGVERVPTWHRRDAGVALVGEYVQISQLVTDEHPACIEFRLLADTEPGVQVVLEMDFQDDGSAEYSHPIPDADFRPLVYSIPTPTWFESVRFVLRKQGAGRAVLAQISAFAGGDCAGERLAMADRPNGARCEEDGQCRIGLCGEQAAPAGMSGLPRVCGACSANADCPDDQLCGVMTGPQGWSPRACVQVASVASGEACVQDGECAAGACFSLSGRNWAHAAANVCGACSTEAGCAGDAACGVVLPAGGAPTSGCGVAGRHELGERCLGDAECATGTCCAGICSECCAAQGCAEDAACGRNTDAEQYSGDDYGGYGAALWYVSLPHQCDPGARDRPAGAGCLIDPDCASGACVGAGAIAVCHSDGRRCDHDPSVCDADGQICVDLGALAGVCE